MTARILDFRHWLAARERRANRQCALMRFQNPASPARPTLDDLIGRAFDPPGGAA